MSAPRKQELLRQQIQRRARRHLPIPPGQVKAAGLIPGDVTQMRAGIWKSPVPPKTPLQIVADQLVKYVAKPHPSQVETADAVRTAAQAIILLATPLK